MKKISVIILSLFLVFSFLYGCSSKLQSNKIPSDTIKQAVTSTTAPTPALTPTTIPMEDKWKAVLYFSDKNAEHIVKEEREIFTSKRLEVNEKAVSSVQLLMKESNANLITTIPAKTKVYSVIFDKDTAIIDLSKEFVTDNVGGTAGETMAIAPIVLTLTAIEGISQVQFKIDGKVQSDFKGHFTLDRPFKRSDFEQYLVK